MNARHRQKTFLGLGLWVISWLMIIYAIAADHEAAEREKHILFPIGLVGILGIYPFYFWGCSNLAGGKGYPAGIALIGIIPFFQLVAVTVLFALEDKSRKPMRRVPQKSSSRRGSKTESIVRCRRNALVGIVFGMAGIGAGVLLYWFRWGIFRDHANEVVMAIFVFAGGYIGVVAGGWNWIKAKHWPEELALIGLAPFAIILVPFVRIIFFSDPTLVAFSMIMMPIILVVVIAVLPDKSGWAGRKRWRVQPKSGFTTSNPVSAAQENLEHPTSSIER